jgi:hypothetical protein
MGSKHRLAERPLYYYDELLRDHASTERIARERHLTSAAWVSMLGVTGAPALPMSTVAEAEAWFAEHPGEL